MSVAAVLDFPPRIVAHQMIISADAGIGHEVRMRLVVSANGMVVSGEIEEYSVGLSDRESDALLALQAVFAVGLEIRPRPLTELPAPEGTIAAALIREARVLRGEIGDE